MRPTVYFPELRLGDAVVPAHATSEVEPYAIARVREITTRDAHRIEDAAAPRSPRRRPFVDSMIIEA